MLGKGVKRPLRLGTTYSWNAAQTVRDEAAASGELRSHGFNLVLGAFQGRDTRFLRKGCGAGHAVYRQPHHVGHQLRRQDAVAQPPAGHCIALGEAVKDDGALLHTRYRRDAEMLSGVEDVLVDSRRPSRRGQGASSLCQRWCGVRSPTARRPQGFSGVLRMMSRVLSVIWDSRLVQVGVIAL